MVISLNVMEIRPKGSRKELILLDHNFSATLINSTSSEVFTVTNELTTQSPMLSKRPLKCRDNLVIHAFHPSEALGKDLIGFTIGRNLFPRSRSIVHFNGKGKLGGEENVPPRECAKFELRKGGRIVLQRKK